MRIALIQQHADHDRTNNLKRALDAMGRAADAGARLVAFAELALERFFPQQRGAAAAEAAAEVAGEGPVSSAIRRRAAELGLVTVFNHYEIANDGKRYDGSPVFDADGCLLGVTRMMHVAEMPGFHEQEYYSWGRGDAPVYDTAVGRIGVAICYDRHYPEYMRRLGERGAQLVVIPQAGSLNEWPDGLFEAELRVAAFQNGYFTALCNRVGQEEALTFGGESFVCDPEGQVVARGPAMQDAVVVADIDLSRCDGSTARRLFWRDRRPENYRSWPVVQPSVSRP
ncbi:MAG: carbon-nitrogen hydrolase family protein [Gemmatimonadetes bacterium]|nr:carbon-nitrogen hydrolase family protein [Gemmatimonadota bacterium]